MRPGCHTDRKHHTHCSLKSVSPGRIPPGSYSWQPQTLPACPPFLSPSSFTWINPLKASFLMSRKHAPSRFDSRSPVLLHPSGGHNCLTICRLQRFFKPQVCVEYGKRTRKHQSGHQSSYWLWTSVNTRTGVTHSPPHPT